MKIYIQISALIFKQLMLSFFIVNSLISVSYAQDKSDKILGVWKSSANDMSVEVYKEGELYKAKVVWFACESGYKMSDFFDKKNPKYALRNRPWLGMNVLDNLEYKKVNEWHNGKIYDPNTGRTFSSICRLENDNTLRVRGYWLYEWMGKDLTFFRTTP
ncbi:MAG: DUF2147 domain-containing protein [Saprospiraceae bacterium]|nr:DUF2147 domain-containing protein [Saprospiraceae bacterium]